MRVVEGVRGGERRGDTMIRWQWRRAVAAAVAAAARGGGGLGTVAGEGST